MFVSSRASRCGHLSSPRPFRCIPPDRRPGTPPWSHSPFVVAPFPHRVHRIHRVSRIRVGDDGELVDGQGQRQRRPGCGEEERDRGECGLPRTLHTAPTNDTLDRRRHGLGVGDASDPRKVGPEAVERGTSARELGSPACLCEHHRKTDPYLIEGQPES